MPIVSDITREAAIRQVSGALEVTRTFRISGLISSTYDVLFDALTFAGVPAVGDAYPGGRTEYRVRELLARPDGGAGNDVLVVVTYSDKTGATWNQQTPDPGDAGQDVKQVSSGLTTVTTTTDVGGAPMTITVPASAGVRAPYLSKASTQKPVANIVFERTETLPPTTYVRNQVGKTNTFTVGAWPAGSLLFTRLDAQSVDGGRVWRTIYEFAFSSLLWVHRDRYARADGKVPADAVEQTWDIYQDFDYSFLNLDFSDNQTPLP